MSDCAVLSAAVPSLNIDPVNCCISNANIVSCADSNIIQSLNFNGLNLGAFPDFRGLKNLQVLFLDNAGLTGQIPNYWDQMPALYQLHLGCGIPTFAETCGFNVNNPSPTPNKLVGPLPSSFTKSEITFLHVENNQLIGDYADVINNMPSLQFIALFGNCFSGRLTKSPYGSTSQVTGCPTGFTQLAIDPPFVAPPVAAPPFVAPPVVAVGTESFSGPSMTLESGTQTITTASVDSVVTDSAEKSASKSGNFSTSSVVTASSSLIRNISLTSSDSIIAATFSSSFNSTTSSSMSAIHSVPFFAFITTFAFAAATMSCF